MPIQNLFTNIPASLTEEFTEILVESCEARVERIVSNGHVSPPNFWYDQHNDEWVAVLQGAATLTIEEETVSLGPGDHVMIPAGVRHRVEWTSPNEPTIWLAVFLPTGRVA